MSISSFDTGNKGILIQRHTFLRTSLIAVSPKGMSVFSWILMGWGWEDGGKMACRIKRVKWLVASCPIKAVYSLEVFDKYRFGSKPSDSSNQLC